MDVTPLREKRRKRPANLRIVILAAKSFQTLVLLLPIKGPRDVVPIRRNEAPLLLLPVKGRMVSSQNGGLISGRGPLPTPRRSVRGPEVAESRASRRARQPDRWRGRGGLGDQE